MATATVEPHQDGDKYRQMILAAIEKQRGAHVGAALTCDYTQAKGGYEFFMWTGAHPSGKTTHTLLASETSQERLDAHWQGFVANLSPTIASPLSREGTRPASERWRADPATGSHYGAIREISDTEVIQHIGQGKHVAWKITDLSGEKLNVDDVVQIDDGGRVQKQSDRATEIGM